ncbi:MAG: hypothetical protein M5U34_12925 [Chloroflexi bacterium]|nr:hypothetical protein [Chloroflexota bacterium]
MTKQTRTYIILFTLAIFALIFYWLLPISGKIAYIPASLTANKHLATSERHQQRRKRTGNHRARCHPWTFVRLELAGTEATLVEHGSQNAEGVWQWRWQAVGVPEATSINLYHSCNTGCQLWTKTETAVSATLSAGVSTQLTPTKLGLVFANPERDWHNRQRLGHRNQLRPIGRRTILGHR